MTKKQRLADLKRAQELSAMGRTMEAAALFAKHGISYIAAVVN